MDEVEAHVKYEGYIKRQKIDIERLQRNENTPIPQTLNYESVVGLSNEVKQKLSEANLKVLPVHRDFPELPCSHISFDGSLEKRKTNTWTVIKKNKSLHINHF